MGDDDARLGRLEAVLGDELAVGVAHVEAVDQHDGADGHVHARAAQAEHVGHLRLGEVEPGADLVVPLVEGAAGDEDADHAAAL